MKLRSGFVSNSSSSSFVGYGIKLDCNYNVKTITNMLGDELLDELCTLHNARKEKVVTMKSISDFFEEMGNFLTSNRIEVMSDPNDSYYWLFYKFTDNGSLEKLENDIAFVKNKDNLSSFRKVAEALNKELAVVSACWYEY